MLSCQCSLFQSKIIHFVLLVRSFRLRLSLRVFDSHHRDRSPIYYIVCYWYEKNSCNAHNISSTHQTKYALQQRNHEEFHKNSFPCYCIFHKHKLFNHLFINLFTVQYIYYYKNLPLWKFQIWNENFSLTAFTSISIKKILVSIHSFQYFNENPPRMSRQEKNKQNSVDI